MKNDWIDVLGFGCVMTIIGVFIGAIIDQQIMTYKINLEWQRECIRRDVADHNPQTGEWQWKCVPADETIQPVRLEQ